jgi:hypothetical protein
MSTDHATPRPALPLVLALLAAAPVYVAYAASYLGRCSTSRSWSCPGRKFWRRATMRGSLRVSEGHLALGLAFGLMAYATLTRRSVRPVLWLAAAGFGRRESVSGVARALAVPVDSRPMPMAERTATLGAMLLGGECPSRWPVVGGDQTGYQLSYPRLRECRCLVPTPWSFWGTCHLRHHALHRRVVLRRRVGGSSTSPSASSRRSRSLARPARVWTHRRRVVGGPLLQHAVHGHLIRACRVRAHALRSGAMIGVLAWRRRGARLRRRGQGRLPAGTKLMGVLAPALLAVIFGIAPGAYCCGRARPSASVWWRCWSSPCYLRNAAATGNPIFRSDPGSSAAATRRPRAARRLRRLPRDAQKAWAGAYGSWRRAPLS